MIAKVAFQNLKEKRKKLIKKYFWRFSEFKDEPLQGVSEHKPN